MKKLGFTLIELLVVIAIIGILLALGTSSFITAQKQARDSKRKADLEQIRQALETNRAENGQYPTNDTSNAPVGLTPDYISELPSDSKGYTYDYTRTSATVYSLCGALEIEPASPDTCSTNCGATACNYRLNNP